MSIRGNKRQQKLRFLFLLHTEAYKSRMFGSSRDRDRVMKILKEQAVTINMHQKCVTPQVGSK